MLVIDLILGALIVAAIAYGRIVGLGRALPTAGFAAGVVLGSRLPLLVGEELDSDFALVIALPAALIVGALLAALAERWAPRAARRVHRKPAVDAGAGALLGGVSAAVVVWALAPPVSEISTVRDWIERSEVLDRMNAVLEPAGAVRTKAPPAIDDFPRFAGRAPRVAPGVRQLVFDTDVERAERSVVKIFATDCEGPGTASGWVAGEGIVVTNAHVVAAMRALTVQLRGRGPRMPAVPIWFDGIHDLAIVRVAQLRGVRALKLAADTEFRVPAVGLGFPGGRRARVPARLGPTTAGLKGPFGGGDTPGVSDTITGRLVTVLRGATGPGSSGGPFVDAGGDVVATVFGGSVLRDTTFAVPNRIVRSALRRARSGKRARVPDCDDPPLKPTVRESRAARAA